MIKKIINQLLSKLGYKIVCNKRKIEPLKKKLTHQQYLNGDVESPFLDLPFAGQTIKFLIENYNFRSVLDIGSGEGRHTEVFKSFNKIVTSIDYGKSIYYEKKDDLHEAIIADYYNYKFEKEFEAIWVSHVLEHQPNPNLFLIKIHSDLKEGGVLAITVPPLKNQIVGGHVTLWNAGLLIYHLILAGFNCRNCSVKSYGYNISVVLIKKTIHSYPELSYDNGDVNKLIEFFPKGLIEPFDGQIKEYNWVING